VGVLIRQPPPPVQAISIGAGYAYALRGAAAR
jgi:hypothetical protein